MAFPPAHALIGAGLGELVSAGRPLPRWKVWLVAGTAAALPDCDIVIGILRGRGGAYHGTFTHSISAVVVIALLVYAFAGPRWSLVAGAGYASHLLVDLLDETGPTNLMLGWPFTGQQPYSIAKVFPKVPVEGNGMIDTALRLLRPDALEKLVLQTLLGAAIGLVLMLLAALLRWRRRAANLQPGA
jgi:membrane-bound metal-dependent hydrolase YbcI (DUF457 family)